MNKSLVFEGKPIATKNDYGKSEKLELSLDSKETSPWITFSSWDPDLRHPWLKPFEGEILRITVEVIQQDGLQAN